ncbi:hydantoinase/oxoprolinase family protein [Halobellus sp. GM3]|uniref:hydantoinase/oxoprolinase family protein n=1 Tax=Halobellus sp. GM3 TaxID=3458410 RepID=UPI00403E1BC2
MAANNRYAAGIDIGGTFTDCSLVAEDGSVYIGKSPSTPEDRFKSGFFNSIQTAAERAGEDPNEIFEKLTRITHGTTIATNAIVEDAGAKVGLLTTKGHEDSLRMMRGRGRTIGEPPENILKVAEIQKPDPLIPESLIYGVPERVDSGGDVVVSLNTDAVRDAVTELVREHDVDGIAVSYLWAFKNDGHEVQTREIIEDVAGEDVFVSLSSEVAPSIGEYERTTATTINSIVGPLIDQYLEDVESELRERHGFDGTFLLMGCNGGSLPVPQAVHSPIMLIGSGPVGGLKASQRMADLEDIPNVLATDMGGTSFELGVINDGRPLVQDTTTLGKHFYDIPKLDIKSIGAGGGSIATVSRGEINVGPESAGSNPGPVCYGRGGTEATVTDANLLLGYISPETSFGTESMKPAYDRAQEAIGELGEEVGKSPVEMASAIFQIANAKMANLIEQEVIGRGYDPRDYHVISYGGAGPIHASSYARQLDTKSIVVPGEISPVLSSYGILNSDLRYELEEQLTAIEPFDDDHIEARLSELKSRGREILESEGVASEDIDFDCYGLMRFEGQYHDLEVAIPNGLFERQGSDGVIDRFKSQYSQRYSATAVSPEAKIELVSLRVEPVGTVRKYDRQAESRTTDSIPSAASLEPREIYWPDRGAMAATQIYDGREMLPGNEIVGPTVIEMPNTSVVVRAEQQIAKNEYGDFIITNGGN